MKLAVNYSTPAAELLYQGHIAFDYLTLFILDHRLERVEAS